MFEHPDAPILLLLLMKAGFLPFPENRAVHPMAELFITHSIIISYLADLDTLSLILPAVKQKLRTNFQLALLRALA